MELPTVIQPESSRVIVVANEKGGSGKSTVAIHLAVALLKAGEQVATIDLDSGQKSLTRYIENRCAWAEHIGRGLEIPEHYCLSGEIDPARIADEGNALIDVITGFAKSHGTVIIDTPGHSTRFTSLVHSMADILITPLNDSFVDFDVLGAVDPITFQVVRSSHYSAMVEEARRQRGLINPVPTDWIVLRNRVSMLASRNKRLVGEGLQDLSHRLGFRCIDGLSERVIFREFYPRGLTALDDVNEATLGTRPTMSHVSARQEVQAVLDAIGLSGSSGLNRSRDAA
jgi:chromosome partitioning protein